MTTRIDALIASDLAALGAESHAVSRISAPYRDDAAAALLRRDDLASKIADAIAEALRVLRPAYAHRVARIAAGAAALVAGALSLAAFLDRRTIAEPTLALPALGLAVVAAYALALRFAARSFERRLRWYFAPRGDVYTQIDRLSLAPRAFGHILLDARAIPSVVWPIAGASVLIPAAAYLYTGTWLWSADARSHIGMLADGVPLVSVACALGAASSLFVRRALRSHAGATWLRWLRPRIGILSASLLLSIAFRLDALVAFAVVPAVFALSTSLAVWTLAREDARAGRAFRRAGFIVTPCRRRG